MLNCFKVGIGFAWKSGMKKILLIASLVGFSGLVQATTINAPSALANGLDGNYAYSWGISIAVPSGQTVASARIDFVNITLIAANSSGTGYLYTDLLNSQTTGVTTKFDNDAAGDNWATQFTGANITSLGSKFFPNIGSSQTWNYVLNTAQLVALNSYLTTGTFNIGFDPDCHYSVGSISFTYTLSPKTNNVPDAGATALMMLMALAGLEVFRRYFVAVKVKA